MINQAHIFILQVDLLDFSWRVGPDLSATNDSDDPMSLFTFILKEFAEETIPKTLPVPERFNKPWFSICKDATKERNRALERFKREPTEGNLNAYRIARAKARRDIRHCKKTSSRNYVSNMNS